MLFFRFKNFVKDKINYNRKWDRIKKDKDKI